MRYLANLTKGRLVLWCYLIWYLVYVWLYFEPNPNLWLSSLGISAIIGIALWISTTADGKTELSFWSKARLFIMPFCVSSFAALIKGHSFVLIFSPRLGENLTALGCCGVFCAAVGVAKAVSGSR